MDRTRGVFFVIVGIAILGVGIAAFIQYAGSPLATISGAPPTAQQAQLAQPQSPTTTSSPEAIVNVATAAPTETTQTAVAPLPTAIPTAAAASSAASGGGPKPIWGPNYIAGDGKPTYICGTDAFASYLTLIQMQAGGFDIKHGFHLGLIPFELNEQEYSVTAEAVEVYMQNGDWDCTLSTVDSIARTSFAVMTGIVDESAGGDGMWARDTETIYDLKGKRVVYPVGTSADFYIRYVLQIAQLDPQKDVTLMPLDSIDDAVAAFNKGEADVLSGWEPQLSQAGQSGGTPLVTSDSLRIIIDAILTSRKSIENKPSVVQAFHDAWFDAMKTQTENFDASAGQIAAWGNNEWTAVTKENAPIDFRDQLKLIAQADLKDNLAVMSNLAPIANQINVSRKVWSLVQAVPSDAPETLIDPRFVQQSAQRAELQTESQPVNDTFSLAAAKVENAAGATDAAAVPAQPAGTAAVATPQSVAAAPIATDEQATLAVLPCRKFTFLPNSIELTQESRSVLDLCVVPTLQQRAGLFLQVKGSAAWPGPQGTYTEAQVQAFAKSRAQAIADYLISQKVDPARLVVEGIVPPPERRETNDPIKQAEDRFVEMSLIAGGF